MAMSRFITGFAASAAMVVGTSSATWAIDFTVDPAAPWLGFMNWFDTPENGGAYVGGSPWGTADLTATFAGANLTLGPNSVNDPNPYWYVGGGGPGALGNKIMDANMYVEPAGSLPGQTVTFSGNVLSNTFASGYTAVAFIKDFAPDFSSFVGTTVPLTPGNFTLTLNTINDPARHVQYGFTVNGRNVWVTDRAPIGTAVVTAFVPSTPGDFDNDGDLDAADIDTLLRATSGAVPPADAKFDLNSSGTVVTAVGAAGSDSDYWVQTLKQTRYGDADLNANVNFNDLLVLAQNYNTGSSPSWSLGNFNGNESVGFDDLLLLAQNYNFGVALSGDEMGLLVGSGIADDWALAQSLVPEPTSLSLLAGLALVTRRRR
jgi:hypothetical protein